MVGYSVSRLGSLGKERFVVSEYHSRHVGHATIDHFDAIFIAYILLQKVWVIKRDFVFIGRVFITGINVVVTNKALFETQNTLKIICIAWFYINAKSTKKYSES